MSITVNAPEVSTVVHFISMVVSVIVVLTVMSLAAWPAHRIWEMISGQPESYPASVLAVMMANYLLIVKKD